jgi:thiosulfate/3-mercaptopyruvate sulfurtransferase
MGVEELALRLSAEGPAGPGLRLCELRWSPAGPTPRSRYDQGHLPGAVFMDMDRDLSVPQARGPGGRHPFPPPETLARALARLGIGPETLVVVYDDGPGTVAGRLWFLLRAHGHRRVRLLDGGLAAWTASGRPLSTQEPAVAPAPLRTLALDRRRLVDRAWVAGLVAGRAAAGPGAPLLLDVRAPERYRGEVEPLDPVAGHIPGARNLPVGSLARGPSDPRLLPADRLRTHFEAAGAASGRELVVACGSGVNACVALLALEDAGFPEARLYAGSFSDWISEPGAPVALGGDPG